MMERLIENARYVLPAVAVLGALLIGIYALVTWICSQIDDDDGDYGI